MCHAVRISGSYLRFGAYTDNEVPRAEVYSRNARQKAAHLHHNMEVEPGVSMTGPDADPKASRRESVGRAAADMNIEYV